MSNNACNHNLATKPEKIIDFSDFSNFPKGKRIYKIIGWPLLGYSLDPAQMEGPQIKILEQKLEESKYTLTPTL